MDLPPVTIIITTYDPGNNSRFHLLVATVHSFLKNIQYPNVSWVISDDGSKNFPKLALDSALDGQEKVYLDANRAGVGTSKNNALRLAFEKSPLVLLSEDDWVLNTPYDLIPDVFTLMNYDDVGMVRYGYLGGSMEAVYTNYADTSYWKLKHQSGHYVYSGQVSLRHKRFYDSLGYHSEGIEPGQEEDEFCHRYNDHKAPPSILWPARFGTVLNTGLFTNIGIGYSTNSVEPGR